jgi:hypothetical protein
MIQVETILIPYDTDVEQHPSHLRSKATSVANIVNAIAYYLFNAASIGLL